MSSSTSNNVSNAQNSRSSIHLDGKTKSTMDQRELQLLEDHQPWEMLDNTVLSIIEQTYAALLEILGLAVPPDGGGPVKAKQLVNDIDPDSPASPMLCVVEASAKHCCVRLVDFFDDAGGIGAWFGPDLMRYISFSQRRRQSRKRRTSVSTSLGMLHLARADGSGGGEGEASKGGHGSKSTDDDDDDRLDISEKGLVGVLDTMRSHLDNAIQRESIVIRMANRSGCFDKLRESFMVRMALQGMRREVDIGAVMRRCRYRRYHRRAREIIVGRRRRPAEEMDVDQVDDAEVLTKRLKAMHV